MGLNSLANNSPRNRKRNRVGIVKTLLTRQRGGEGARVGILLLAELFPYHPRGQPPLPRASTSLLSYTWRVEDTHTHAEHGHSSPERGRRAHKYSLGIFKDRFFFFFLEGWQPGRGGGKERRLPAEPRAQ